MTGLCASDSAHELKTRLSISWEKEKKRSDGAPSLLRALCFAFGFEFLWVGRILLLGMVCHMAQPQLLGLLVNLIQDSGAPLMAWIYAGLLVMTAAVYALCHAGGFFRNWRWGLRWRVAVMSLMHDKLLCLELHSAHGGEAGHLNANPKPDSEPPDPEHEPNPPCATTTLSFEQYLPVVPHVTCLDG